MAILQAARQRIHAITSGVTDMWDKWKHQQKKQQEQEQEQQGEEKKEQEPEKKEDTAS